MISFLAEALFFAGHVVIAKRSFQFREAGAVVNSRPGSHSAKVSGQIFFSRLSLPAPFDVYPDVAVVPFFSSLGRTRV